MSAAPVHMGLASGSSTSVAPEAGSPAVGEPVAESPAPAPKRLSDVAPSTRAAASAPAPAAAAPPVAPAEPSAPTPPPPAAAPKPAAPAPTAGVDLQQFVSMWPAVLEALKGYSRVAWMGFSSSAPISISNGDLAVAVADAGTVKGVKNSGHDERLRQAVLDVMRTDVRIDVVLAPDRVGSAPAAPSAATAASAPSADPAPAPTAAEPDAPSLDDPDVEGAVGVDLALRELGATQIGEIEH